MKNFFHTIHVIIKYNCLIINKESYEFYLVHTHWYTCRLSGRKITRGGGFGLFTNLLLGIVGGVLGGWVFSLLGFQTTSIIGNLTTSTVGAILLLWIASFFKRGD